MAKVTICIPTYNGAGYLGACLESVLCQTYEDTEILLVDDGSADATIDIASRYAATDGRIQLVRNKKNLGLVGNWNRCIELAQSEWIKFVFQDDLITPYCLERMIEAGTGHETTLVVCRREFIYESVPAEIREIYREYEEDLSIGKIFSGKSVISPADFCQAVLERPLRNFVGEPTSLLIHRKMIDRFGVFNPNLIQLCDFEYCVRVGINVGLTYVPETLVQFRVHQTSATSSNASQRQYFKDVVDPLLVLYEYAHNPMYSPLRHASQRGHVDLRRLFFARLSKTVAEARISSKSQVSLGPDAREQWETAMKIYPWLRPSWNQYFQIGLRLQLEATRRRVRNFLERHLFWRFRT
jgi:GT2 family glycosyltransferase